MTMRIADYEEFSGEGACTVVKENPGGVWHLVVNFGTLQEYIGTSTEDCPGRITITEAPRLIANIRSGQSGLFDSNLVPGDEEIIPYASWKTSYGQSLPSARSFLDGLMATQGILLELGETFHDVEPPCKDLVHIERQEDLLHTLGYDIHKKSGEFVANILIRKDGLIPTFGWNQLDRGTVDDVWHFILAMDLCVREAMVRIRDGDAMPLGMMPPCEMDEIVEKVSPMTSDDGDIQFADIIF